MKPIEKLGFKLVLLLLPFFGIAPLMLKCFPMSFFDGDYAEYIQNENYAESHKNYARILIMGDSLAKSSWIPEQLSGDTYNWAIAASCPVEEYYYLYDYLKRNDPPKYIIYTQAIYHFIGQEAFWTRAVYFHRFSEENVNCLIKDLEAYEDSTVFGEEDIMQNYQYYKYYSPVKYSWAFVKGLADFQRFNRNKERYNDITCQKGQAYYGTAKNCVEKQTILVEGDEFAANEILDAYFKKIIDLCGQYDIQFIFQNGPINEITYCEMQKEFINEYMSYLECLQREFPDSVIGLSIPVYNSKYFGDPSHLNASGAAKFSKEMRNKYNEIFKQS